LEHVKDYALPPLNFKELTEQIWRRCECLW